MEKKLTGVEAAMMEHRGEGNFSLEGRSIVFRSGQLVWNWMHSSPKEAATILKVLRAAPKYCKEGA